MSSSLESLIREEMSAKSGSHVGTDFAAYVIVGLLAIAGYVGLSAALMLLAPAVPQWVVSAVAYAMFVFIAYVAHWQFAFRTKVEHKYALSIYLLIQACTLGLATVFSWLVYGVASMPTIPAAITVMVLTSGASFIALRIWAFDRRKGSRSQNT